MFEANTTSTYLIDEPFGRGLPRVRAALEKAGIALAGELDLAVWLRKELVLNLPRCVVLFARVSSNGGRRVEPHAAAVAPLHVVVSARGARTAVHFLRAAPLADAPIGASARAELGRLQAGLSRAIEQIGSQDLDA